MKAVTIFCNVANDEEIIAIFHDVGITEYSKIPRSYGKGLVTGPRMDDHIWPGFNVTYIVVVADAMAPKLMTALQEFRNGQGRRTGFYAYQTHVDAVLAPPPSGD